jgi:uncharacterized protein YcnI
MSETSVRRATLPANTTTDGEMIGAGRRVRATGTIKVTVPEGVTYRPPDGWTMTAVRPAAKGNYTSVHLTRSEQ